MVECETYPGVQAVWPGATMRRQADPVFGIETLVLHTPRQTGTDAAIALMQAGRASWHWIIPAEGEAPHGHFLWSAVPEARAARHLPNRLRDPRVAEGRGPLNHVSLAVLLAAPSRGVTRPDSPHSVWQVAILGRLIRNLWARYPRLGSVVCRSELDTAVMPSMLDMTALRHAVAAQNSEDLPPLVAGATPLALLERGGRPEPDLRAD